MKIESLLAIQEFLDRYKAKSASLSTQRLKEFQKAFQRINSAFRDLTEAYANERLRTAGSFNIFRTLGRAHLEVQCHSAFLWELFRPDGDHGQGKLFLRTFLRHVPTSSIPEEPEIEAAQWIVEKEKSTPFGRLDLSIASPKLQFCTLIENKIYALEQKDQIDRYAEWLQSVGLTYGKDSVIVFLTIDGGQAFSASPFTKYVRMSYKKNIAEWLQAILAKIEAPRMIDIVEQYLKVIEDL